MQSSASALRLDVGRTLSLALLAPLAMFLLAFLLNSVLKVADNVSWRLAWISAIAFAAGYLWPWPLPADRKLQKRLILLTPGVIVVVGVLAPLVPYIVLYDMELERFSPVLIACSQHIVFGGLALALGGLARVWDRLSSRECAGAVLVWQLTMAPMLTPVLVVMLLTQLGTPPEVAGPIASHILWQVAIITLCIPFVARIARTGSMPALLGIAIAWAALIGLIYIDQLLPWLLTPAPEPRTP